MSRSASIQRRPPQSKWGCIEQPCLRRHDEATRRTREWRLAHAPLVHPETRETLALPPAEVLPLKVRRGSPQSVGCPICDAKRGYPCVVTNPKVVGNSGPFGFHPSRVEKAKPKEAVSVVS